MPTQSDIEDGKRIDMRVKVLSELDRPSEKMAKRLHVRDTDGNEFPLTIWKNNALSDYAWERGRWYELENARGNEFRGEKSLNGSSRLCADPIDNPTDSDQSQQTTTVGSIDELFDSLEDGLPYLSLFPIDREFETVDVYEYRIEADGPFDDDPMDATYSLAAYLRSCSDAAVTHAGVFLVIATSRLTNELPDPFELTDESRVTLPTHYSTNRSVSYTCWARIHPLSTYLDTLADDQGPPQEPVVQREVRRDRLVRACQ